jgi:hypothetical protein
LLRIALIVALALFVLGILGFVAYSIFLIVKRLIGLVQSFPFIAVVVERGGVICRHRAGCQRFSRTRASVRSGSKPQSSARRSCFPGGREEPPQPHWGVRAGIHPRTMATRNHTTCASIKSNFNRL